VPGSIVSIAQHYYNITITGIHYSVCDPNSVSAFEMTYIVSGGALNSTHSLTQILTSIIVRDPCLCDIGHIMEMM